MNGPVLTVAAWELRRWFKWRDQFVTLLICAFSASVMGFVAGRAGGDESERVTVAVIGSMDSLADTDRFEFVPLEEEDLGYARAVPWAGDRDAVVEIFEDAPPELYVEEASDWVPELAALLDQHGRRLRLEALDPDPAILDALTAESGLETHLQGTPDRSTAQLVTAFLVIGIVLLAVFLGMTYQFVAITGEKQVRVTELMLSAVTPQQWIDGKILGLTIFSLMNLVTYGVSAVEFFWIGRLWGVELPFDAGFLTSSGLPWTVAFGLGGFLLWNTTFAAIAATISDPNTSARGGLLMLPLLSAGLAAVSLSDPDALWARVFTLLPPTSWSFVPLRLVVGEVETWELLLALVLLFGASLGLRTFAGRIFHASILMTGRDPSWREMGRFLRRTPRQDPG